jgi:cysteine-rich repeat protein
MRSRSALLLALSTLYLGGCGVIFGIDAPKHRAPVVCGDGAIGAGEECDDAATEAGDGCDPTCQIEAGYTCVGQPSVCTQCGDGKLEDREACDDGNRTSGDGCDATCAPEPGYVCVGEPSVCALCGDGQIAGAETCDDGNATPGDGCNAACAIEHGFTCDGAPSVCKASCGDGVVASTEQCDDGNTKVSDGCDSTCHVEHGFGCIEEPSICQIHCGDGKLGPGEQCDDGNNAAGDGCGVKCTREAGFTCDTGEPTKCLGICGDGLVVAGESCDDANFKPGDGCDAACAVEPGFACTGRPSECSPLCGDGIVLPSEQCDDGNTTSGDCCSASCQVEPGCEAEPNNTTAEADALASGVNPVGFTGDGKIRGSIGVVGDEDLFAFDLAPAQSVVRIETFDASGADCAAGVDTKVTLLNSLGVPVPTRSDDDSGIGTCSALEINLASGGYFLRVQQATNSAVIPWYTLEVDVQPSAGAEVEGNNTTGAANVFSSTDGFMSGSHQTANDIDFYKLTIPGVSPRSLRAEILEGAAEACESDGIQSRLTLFDAGAMQLADDDVGQGRGLCSLLDGTGTVPSQPSAHGLFPGVYYLRVMAASAAVGASAQFDYKLAVTVR